MQSKDEEKKSEKEQLGAGTSECFASLKGMSQRAGLLQDSYKKQSSPSVFFAGWVETSFYREMTTWIKID